MRCFDIQDIHEIEMMSFNEYQLRMTAYRLKQIDKQYLISFAAWQNREIKASKEDGEYIYQDFKKFFDYELNEKAVFLGESPEQLKNKEFSNQSQNLAELFKRERESRRKE